MQKIRATKQLPKYILEDIYKKLILPNDGLHKRVIGRLDANYNIIGVDFRKYATFKDLEDDVLPEGYIQLISVGGISQVRLRIAEDSMGKDVIFQIINSAIQVLLTTIFNLDAGLPIPFKEVDLVITSNMTGVNWENYIKEDNFGSKRVQKANDVKEDMLNNERDAIRKYLHTYLTKEEFEDLTKGMTLNDEAKYKKYMKLAIERGQKAEALADAKDSSKTNKVINVDFKKLRGL